MTKERSIFGTIIILLLACISILLWYKEFDKTGAANRIKLFAHYDKMRILEYLILYGPSHVNALADGVGIDPLKVSQFLKKMRDDEFVSYTKKGRFVFYEILTGVHKTAIECIRKRYQTLTDKRLF